MIDRVDLPAPHQDPLAAQLADPGWLPPALRPFLDPNRPATAPEVMLTGEGFVVTGPDGQKKTYPVTLDVPTISWPVGATRDSDTGILYAVTLGGEGFLYSYDPRRDKWAVESSLHQADPSGIIYDPGQRRLVIIVTGTIAPKGQGLLFYGADHRKSRTALKMSTFPGLAETLRGSGGAGPALVPLAVADGKILLRTQGDRRAQPGLGEKPALSRTYMVDMATGAVQLVAYTDPDAQEADPW